VRSCRATSARMTRDAAPPDRVPCAPPVPLPRCSVWLWHDDSDPGLHHPCGTTSSLRVIRGVTLGQNDVDSTLTWTATNTGSATIFHVRGWLVADDNYIGTSDDTDLAVGSVSSWTPGISGSGKAYIAVPNAFTAGIPGNTVEVKGGDDMAYFGGSDAQAIIGEHQQTPTTFNPSGAADGTTPAMTSPILDYDTGFALFFDFGDLAPGATVTKTSCIGHCRTQGRVSFGSARLAFARLAAIESLLVWNRAQPMLLREFLQRPHDRQGV